MNINLLIVDDEPIITQGLRYTIPWDTYGIKVIGEAEDGEEALEILRKQQVDIVLTDVRMPVMDGIELARTINEQMPRTRVIIISGYDEFEYAREAIRFGVKDYLLKPVDIDELLERVNSLKREIIAEKEASRNLENTVLQEVKLENEWKKSWMVEKAKEYIQAHFHEDLKASEVANEMHITPNYFSMIFKKEMGKSFNEYLNDLKIEKAKHLLINTSDRVFEIAKEVGYKEYKYFVQVFRKKTGMTPTDFRDYIGSN